MDYPLNEDEISEAHPDFGFDKKMTRDGNGGVVDSEGLIVPRKIQNPCLSSKDKQNLHRELLFNQKYGKSVLNQKSELQKFWDKANEKKKIKECEQKKHESKSQFEKKMEERANRLVAEKSPEEEEAPRVKSKPEFLEVHAKIKAKTEGK